MQRTILRSAVLLVIVAMPSDLVAQKASRLPAMKVAFLYNFAKLTEWPADDGSTRSICVLGDGPVAKAVSALDGKTARGKKIITRVLDDPAEARGCHIVFVADSRNATRQLDDASVLTVGDGDNFARNGGMICLHTHRNRLALEINLAAVRDHQLRLDPQLLAISHVINDYPGPGL